MPPRGFQFLNALYCRGIGVSDESIFGFSVQTFTTPSLVRLLADVSATTSSALLPNPENGQFRVLHVLEFCLVWEGLEGGGEALLELPATGKKLFFLWEVERRTVSFFIDQGFVPPPLARRLLKVEIDQPMRVCVCVCVCVCIY